MKKVICLAVVVCMLTLLMSNTASAQDEGNVVHVVKMKTVWPEKGSMKERDSLTAIFNNSVIKKNEKILSHREYGHFFTGSSEDYMVVEEYKDLASLQESWKISVHSFHKCLTLRFIGPCFFC